MPESQGEASTRLTRLLAVEESDTVTQIVEGEQRRMSGSERPRVLLNMVSTADGRATLNGRSAPLSGAADRALFHALRADADAILVGGATVREERYGRVIKDPEARRHRVERGLTPEPLACIVSGRLLLDADIPLLAEPEAKVAVITSSDANVPGVRAHVDYIRSGSGEGVDLAAALAELSTRFGVGLLLCEGGPHLARQLLGLGLIDELCLCLSPLLAAGEPATGEALRIFAGAELEPPAELELLSTFRSGSYLFLRYEVLSARPRVSRETTSSSSLAK
ncbi:MAG TPA: dihydrofolate reductase family protein [Solirubrobacteraceae bacterium]|jgi:riboflavin biosynthesis pyrimidine reductase